MAAIIGFSQWKNSIFQQFEAPERFKNQATPDPLYDKGASEETRQVLQADFTYDAVAGTFICPARKRLWSQLTQLGQGCLPHYQS